MLEKEQKITPLMTTKRFIEIKSLHKDPDPPALPQRDAYGKGPAGLKSRNEMYASRAFTPGV